MSILKTAGAWLSGRAWWVVGLLLAALLVLAGVVTWQRHQMRWLEAARQSAADRAKGATARAEAHARAAQRYQEAAAWAHAELEQILARDASERRRVSEMRQSIDQASTEEEVLDLGADAFGRSN